jgi:glycosyltransferase involved in cell wall biosynthesis
VKTVAMLLVGNISRDGRVQKEVRTLRSHGFHVVLIQWPHAALPGNYASLGIEVIEYLHPLHKSAAVNFLRQMLFNLFAFRQLQRLSPDFVQCNDLNTLPAGFFFRRRARVIYDSHELFPESQSGLRRRVWSVLERWMVPACHAYIQPEKNRLAYFAAKYGIEPGSIALVENYPSGRYAFSNRNRLREHFAICPERIILLCTGVLGPSRDLENMISCMALLDPSFVLVLLGTTFKGYELELASRIAEAKVEDRVKLHPAIPNVEMLDYVQSSDIGLVFYKNTNLNNYWCASNKLYEFILCGKPVITNDYPGLREVVEQNQLGVCIAETSPETIASAVRRVGSKRKGPTSASPYVWEQQEATYLKLFE